MSSTPLASTTTMTSPYILPDPRHDLVRINHSAVIMETKLPVTKGIMTKENTTIQFPMPESLKTILTYPYFVDGDIVEKLVKKLEPVINTTLYPSQIAKLIFEIAFTDPEDIRLTQKQRTDYMGCILSNLGCETPEIIEKLFAFYYAYSFEHFSLNSAQ